MRVGNEGRLCRNAAPETAGHRRLCIGLEVRRFLPKSGKVSTQVREPRATQDCIKVSSLQLFGQDFCPIIGLAADP
jgi:hypothetical protein